MLIVEPLNKENIGIKSTVYVPYRETALIFERLIPDGTILVVLCTFLISEGFYQKFYCIMPNAGITSYIICCVLGIDWIFIVQ